MHIHTVWKGNKWHYCNWLLFIHRRLAFCSFSNLSVTSPTSQLILQPFRHFTNVTAHSPTLPLLHLHHSSFSNPSFASPTSQALHVIHLASRPCYLSYKEPKSPCKFFLILIFNEIFKFKTSDEWQHWKTGALLCSGRASTSCLRSHTDPFAFFIANSFFRNETD